MTSNPAALQGWVKSTDPQTGRVFYANHVTRQTQWEPPANWQNETEEEEVLSSGVSGGYGATAAATPSVTSRNTTANNNSADNSPLPSNWQEMKDPTTGKAFYVDHERKITTWQRPTAEKKVKSMQPAVASPPASGGMAASLALARQLQQEEDALAGVTSAATASSTNHHTTHTHSSSTNEYDSYMASYMTPASSDDADFSYTLPNLEFTVQKVHDSLRPQCSACKSVFSMRNRRHHCRLCGDVFCDACSQHRATLPLSGPEFDGPVRLCDFCHQDVSRGQFFSFRRYLTPLHLYDHDESSEEGTFTAQNVNAALSALTADLRQLLQDPSAIPERLEGLPPDVWMPEFQKHLAHSETADWTICALAAVVALESMILSDSIFPDYVAHIYANPEILSHIWRILDENSVSRKTLYIQEQAARLVYYLVDPKTLEWCRNMSMEDVTSSLDIPTSFCLLEHAANDVHIPLSRWAAAAVANLIREDARRSRVALEEAAAELSQTLDYTSFLPRLEETGGTLLLCTLLASTDGDSRAHAVAALHGLLQASRSLQTASANYAAVTGRNDVELVQEGRWMRAIVSGGACGSAVAQQILSADNAVAGMGLSLLQSLVQGLLVEEVPVPSRYTVDSDTTRLGACREAALQVANGPCLPALLSLMRSSNRPIALRQLASEILCAATYATSQIALSWSDSYEEGLMNAPSQVRDGLQHLLSEGTIPVVLSVLEGQSSIGTADTPAARMREAAGLVLGSLTACSAQAILELPLTLLNSNDASLTVPSTLRGDGAPRCYGVLQAVGNALLFNWKQKDTNLLDRLIQVVDAGAIPYLSRVMNNSMEWEKDVGAMKGRAAACRLLCCLFGIPDATGIGMRRVMDAVEADARSYRGNGKAPSNLIEATLSTLQTASSYARKALIGSLPQGNAAYQAALFDLVGDGLDAIASMCGSSVAPNSLDTFLEARKDAYSTRRQQVCQIACDVVVRGGRNNGPALLPTMLVGGFGESTVGASMRLALAIAQNGGEDQHAKLAMSGILVPISDSLQTALSKGDLPRFSAALSMVRLCGPHVAAGQGGGLEAVRDAIKVATNVLHLPFNPQATLEQVDQQESLKAACIMLLESLSKNASLWNSISTEALPSIVRYLDFGSTGSNEKTQATRAAALRAVLQIVQVPSHAVAAAEAGIADALGNILRQGTNENDPVPMLALEVLHVISSNPDARRQARFLELVRAICNAMGKSSTHQAKKPSDTRADVTFLGLEILHGVLADLEGLGETAVVLQSPMAAKLLEEVASEPMFIRAMCSTLLLKTDMKIPHHESETNETLNVPKLYGPPFILVQETCAGFSDTHEASAAFLYSLSVFACAIEGPSSDLFWKTIMLQGLPGDEENCLRASATLSAHFLSLLTVGYSAFVPKDQYKEQEYTTLTRPLVRHRLLEMLKEAMTELSGDSDYGTDGDPYVISLLVTFNVPHICLSLWKDPALLDLAFELIQQIVEQVPDEVLHLFVEGKPALLSLFDLLNIDEAIETSKNTNEIRHFLAFVLGQLAEKGLLTDAVAKFDVRSSAIAGLAAACLSEQERPVEEDEDTTENRLSTVLMRCLVDLCSVEDKVSSKKRIQLSASESEAIANNLGRKLCQMVLSRFLERARLKEYEMDDDDDIMDAPDVAMLCAVSQHDVALKSLRSIGGLHALGMVAAEGELLAMNALKRASSDDAGVLLEGDAYQALVDLLSSSDEMDWRSRVATRNELEGSAFSLLARLCKSSQGRKAVSESSNCEASLARAIEVVALFAGIEEETEQGSAPEGATDKEDDSSLSEESEVDSDEDEGEVAASASEKVDAQVGTGACLYLASIASTRVGKTVLKESSKVGRALNALSAGTSDSPLEVRFAALKLVSSLATYSTGEGSLSTDGVADIFLAALSSKEKVKSTDELNKNMILESAAMGLTTIFDYLSSEEQAKAVSVVKDRFNKCVKTCILTRSTAKEKDRAHSAELCYNLTIVLLLARGNECCASAFSQDLFASFVNLIQWRVDPKTSIGNTNGKAWDAAVSNCLLLMSMMLWRPEEVLSKSGLDLSSLAETTLMLARPGKAPRKAIDLRSALEKIIEGPDGSSSVAADRVLHRLY